MESYKIVQMTRDLQGAVINLASERDMLQNKVVRLIAETVEHIKKELDNLTIETFENYNAESISAYRCEEVIDILNSLLVKS